MSSISVNTITDASGGATTSINGFTPSVSNMAGRNRIINGGMVFDQRNAGASVTATSNPYTLDRWRAVISQSAKFTVQQNAGSVTPPAGFTNYMGITSLSSYSSGTSERFVNWQGIEGYNISDLAWGTADAKTVTLSFWIRSSLTGTFGGSLVNGSDTRSYPFSYTISSVNTWEYKTVTIPGDTSGTWATNNSAGIYVCFDAGSGSSYKGTVNTWASALYYGPTGATSVVGTSGATFYITGVQLEEGSVATPFCPAGGGSYGAELALCQRYYEVGSVWREGTNAGSGNQCVFTETFKVQKRANATFTFGNVADANSNITSVAGPEAMYESISPFAKTNLVTGFAFRFVPNNATSTVRQYWTASSEL